MFRGLVFALGVTFTFGIAGEIAAAILFTQRDSPIPANPIGLWFKVAYSAFVAAATTPLVAYAALYTVGRSDSELPSLGAVSRKMPDLVSAAGGEERTREERGSTAAIV